VISLVVDASVAAKWFLPPAGETLTTEAMALFTRYSRGQFQFLVPDLFWAEIANIFWKAARQRRWSHSEGETAVRLVRERQIPTVSNLVLLDDAFSIASTFDRTIYDSLYVALAVASKTDLVTADERLANALAAHLPVKWLGTYN
jgi:predicted nucleic acid-binding protein